MLLLIVLAMGLAFNNRLVAAGAGFVLAIKVFHIQTVLRYLDRWSLDFGLLLLLIAVLTPFAMNRVGVREIWDTFRTPPGIIAIVGGTAAAYLCGQGVVLLQMRPEVIVGLVIGTVVGVSLLKGIPVGPLAAAGITAILLNILGLGKK